MNDAPSLYHYVPDEFVGETLYPLSRLAKLHPAIAEEHARKYAGREKLMQVRLPILDCLWNEVLHLAPLHPSVTKAALLASGFQVNPRRFFVIPPGQLDPKLAVYFKHSKDTQGRYDFLAADFVRFEPESYRELAAVPDEQFRYFEHMKAAGEKPLLWARTPHVFYRGELPTKNLTTIDW
jgi:hypothetical protein